MFTHEDPRRVVRAHGGHRRVLRAGAVDGRGARSTRTTSHRGTFVELDGRRAAGPGAAVQPHAGGDPAPAVARRASTPTRSSPTGASTPIAWPSCARPARSPDAMATIVVASTPTPTTSPSRPAGSWPRPLPSGHRVVLVFATRGEHGEVDDGFLEPGETLGQRREKECHRVGARSWACSAVAFLGYVDSGMIGTPENDAATGRSGRTDVDEAAEPLAEHPPRGGRRRAHRLRLRRRATATRTTSRSTGSALRAAELAGTPGRPRGHDEPGPPPAGHPGGRSTPVPSPPTRCRT